MIMKQTDMFLCPLITSYGGGGGRGRGPAKQKIIIIMNHNNVLPVTEAQMRGPQTQTWRNKVSENVSQNK